MKCNIGKTDRYIRASIGIIIFALGLFYQSWWGLIGIVPLATAITGFCGLYTPLKLSTVKIKNNKIEK